MSRRKLNSAVASIPPDRRLADVERLAADVVGDAESDHRLAKRCLAGDVAAWEELYGRFHEPLCRSISSMMGSGGCDLSRVDEIAARVWYALVRNDGELLDRFDPARHTRLGGFLRGLARIEIMQYYRAENRRRVKETACVYPSADESGVSDWQMSALIEDFATTLTPGEQDFLEEHLLGQSDEASEARSQATIWQRCHRIREKLKAFFWGTADKL